MSSTPHRPRAWLALTAALVSSLLLAEPVARAGKLGALQPTSKIDLLAGRLVIRMPAAAKLEARRASIMAAPTAAADESRVVLDAGPERLVLMANELFALAGPRLEETVKKEAAGQWSGKDASFSVEKLAVKGLQVFALLPSALKVRGDAALVLAAYVGSPDGTLQLLRLFVNPPGAQDPKGCLALGRRLLGTLTPGARKLQSAAGPRRLSGYRELEVKLPAGYLSTLQQGPDFQVHHLRKLVPLDQAGPSLSIYLGGHPSYQHRQRQSGAKVTERAGKLFGSGVKWQHWTLEGPAGKSRTMVEAIADLGGKLRAHVFYGSDDPTQLKELAAIADSLRLIKK